MNKFNSIDEVSQVLNEANYLVLGLDDVILELLWPSKNDPRNRLRSMKYSPARTFTSDGAVKIFL